MHILDILREHETTFSSEFFPPRTHEAASDATRRIYDNLGVKDSRRLRAAR